MRSGMIALAAAGALLVGSTSAAAANPAAPLSVVRAGATLEDASDASGGGGFTSLLTPINIVILLGALAALALVASDGDGGNPVDDRPTSP